jgi:hypothetical protein
LQQLPQSASQHYGLSAGHQDGSSSSSTLPVTDWLAGYCQHLCGGHISCVQRPVLVCTALR